MTDKTEILKDLKSRLTEKLGNDLHDLILFGSYAKGPDNCEFPGPLAVKKSDQGYLLRCYMFPDTIWKQNIGANIHYLLMQSNTAYMHDPIDELIDSSFK